MIRVLVAVIVCVGLTLAADAANTDTSPSSNIRLAQVHEQRGEWNQAIGLYRQSLRDDGRSAKVRLAIHRCLCRLEQSRRLNDSTYRDYADGLSLTQSLNVLGEVLTRVPELYWNREQCKIDRLMQHGLDELASGFSELTPLVNAARLVNVATVAEAKSTVRELVLAAKRQFNFNPALLILECAAGACAGLDEYTVFLHPGRDDELTELGLTLRVVNNRLVIESVKMASWAASMGMNAGDQIKRANTGEELEDLTVEAPGEPPRIVRLPSPPPAIPEADLVRDMAHPERNELGYIRIAHFGRQLPLELDSAILRLRSLASKVLVIDLRGNPGGVVQSAVAAAERFLPRGTIISARGQNSSTKSYSTSGPASCDLPMVLLVDDSTASAAEVFAVALKDNNRATLVGQTTHGKAAVQQQIALEAGGGVQMTIAKLFAPRGESYHGIGITPHVLEPRAEQILETGLQRAAELLGR